MQGNAEKCGKQDRKNLRENCYARHAAILDSSKSCLPFSVSLLHFLIASGPTWCTKRIPIQHAVVRRYYSSEAIGYREMNVLAERTNTDYVTNNMMIGGQKRKEINCGFARRLALTISMLLPMDFYNTTDQGRASGSRIEQSQNNIFTLNISKLG